ncbi:39S ribosomal protein L2, partial [Schistosoma japonicum]
DHVHARLYGASLICANISHCLKELAYQYTSESNNSVINKKFLKYPNFLIYCWRGGQRSSSLATILSERGWPGNIYTLVGEYRSCHRLLLQQLDAWPRWSILSPFWVISGLTGIHMNLYSHLTNCIRSNTNRDFVIKLFRSLSFAPTCLTTLSLPQLNKCELSTSCSLNRHPGIIHPRPVSRYWAIGKMRDPFQYTVDALPLIRTGGRGPDGKIQLKHVTTGLNRPWFMVDHNRSRHASTKNIHEELVLQVKKTWWRHPFIALVASGEVKRWIIATANMKPGDIIRSHVDIPAIPVDPKEGDAYPVGALPVGTVISQFEIKPGQGALFCRTAGSSATVVRRGKYVGSKLSEELNSTYSNIELEDEYVVFVRTNGKRKIYRLMPTCMSVVGQVSNQRHDQFKFRKFGEKKWRGIKQRSGLWQRKTGRFGRKIRPIGPPIDLASRKSSPDYFKLKCSYPGRSEYTMRKEQDMYEALCAQNIQRPQPVPGPYNALPDKMRRYRWCSWSSVR